MRHVPLLMLALLVSPPAGAEGHYSSKTPYQPLQSSSSYEAAPAGYEPVQTQIVARHGSRGMTGAKAEQQLLKLWQQAQQQDALTPLGRELGPDLERLNAAHAKLGYGNLSQIGIEEHRQLARRLAARLPALFKRLAAQPGSVQVLNSGVDRARDSAASFSESLGAAVPGLVLAEPQVDRFTLYFHKLNAKSDTLTNPQDPRWAVFRHSQAYQAHQRSPELSSRLAAIKADPRLAAAAERTLAALFKPAFLAQQQLMKPLDALFALSDVYEIAPGLQRELGFSFDRYLPEDVAVLLEEANDAEDFYVKGPGTREQDAVSYAMAEGLLADFLAAAERRDTARLRFTHAEILMPFVTLLGIQGLSEPLPAAQAYSHASSRWRARDAAPYAANVQWDSFRNAEGRVLVRMLLNEKETDFKPSCGAARQAPGSHFYELSGLKACYAAKP
ncbi:histidine-type phosphatase [Pelomonas sp. V22]|uniref:histidine-type phosphatase n=1 Tax=Pelomonas sp. V22 TaxID=2822139 RepID=UPI0024A89810|nr:histidine-type phosphatase [Pelomonas sp. V22]MDI4634531.1 histidine-type phosphatase [Pelomonas sp. V22]